MWDDYASKETKIMDLMKWLRYACSYYAIYLLVAGVSMMTGYDVWGNYYALYAMIAVLVLAYFAVQADYPDMPDTLSMWMSGFGFLGLLMAGAYYWLGMTYLWSPYWWFVMLGLSLAYGYLYPKVRAV